MAPCLNYRDYCVLRVVIITSPVSVNNVGPYGTRAGSQHRKFFEFNCLLLFGL
jgi:hypothetical protein